jgi:hypothetical protein
MTEQVINQISYDQGVAARAPAVVVEAGPFVEFPCPCPS